MYKNKQHSSRGVLLHTSHTLSVFRTTHQFSNLRLKIPSNPRNPSRIRRRRQPSAPASQTPRAPEPSDRRCTSASANSGKPVKPAPQEPQSEHSSSSSSPAILTVSSPEIVRGEPAAAADQFLDECYLCRKRIPHNSDVFMPFGAFCSEACRLQQIYKDRVAEQALVESTGNAIGGVREE